MKYNFRTHAVVIHNTYDANLLEDIVQAQRYVLSILKINEDEEIAPGDLHGMSRMLSNAERTLAEISAAHPSLKRMTNPDALSAKAIPAPCPPLAKAA